MVDGAELETYRLDDKVGCRLWMSVCAEAAPRYVLSYVELLLHALRNNMSLEEHTGDFIAASTRLITRRTLKADFTTPLGSTLLLTTLRCFELVVRMSAMTLLEFKALMGQITERLGRNPRPCPEMLVKPLFDWLHDLTENVAAKHTMVEHFRRVKYDVLEDLEYSDWAMFAFGDRVVFCDRVTRRMMAVYTCEIHWENDGFIHRYIPTANRRMHRQLCATMLKPVVIGADVPNIHIWEGKYLGSQIEAAVQYEREADKREVPRHGTSAQLLQRDASPVV